MGGRSLTRSLLFVLVVAFSGCEGGMAESAGDGAGALAVKVFALTQTCSGVETDPFAEIDKLKVVVTGPDTTTQEIKELKSKTVSLGGSRSVEISDIPEGTRNDVTIMGFKKEDGDTPSWFARKRQVLIVKDKTNSVDMVLTRYGKFTCFPNDKLPTAFTNVIFPELTRLGDGKILITGGFRTATKISDEPLKIEYSNPSDIAFIYDPATGVIEQITSNMLVARGAHAAVYLPLPDGEKVLIFGGINKLTFTEGAVFPFDADLQNAIKAYEVFDVATKEFSEPPTDPKQTLRGRVFPRLARLSDNYVLITGGGKWPFGNDTGYQEVEMYMPPDKIKGTEGGLVELKGFFKMLTQRAGHTVTFIGNDPKTGLSRYLFLGGTINADIQAEIYTQSSQQAAGVNGVFKEVKLSNFPLVYFHSTTALSGQKFLVAGGVQYTPATKKLDTLDDKSLYLLTLGSDDKISVEKIEVDGGAGRFFHTATTADNINVTILGGFTENRCDLDLKKCTSTGTVCDENTPCVKFVDMVKGDTRFFNLNSKKFAVPAGDEPYLSKACHKAVVLQDDTLFLVGGLTSSKKLETASLGFIELYTPSNIALDLVPK